MKKTDFQGEKSLKDVKEDTTHVQYPVPLEFDGKTKAINYLPPHRQNTDSKTIKQGKENNHNKLTIDKPLEGKRFLGQKSNKIFLKVNSDVSENSSCEIDNSDSECNCVKNMIPKKKIEIKIERRRRKKIDPTPFYDQIIYHDPRMRRINFVYSSSGSSDSEYERVQIRKEVIPEKKYKDKPKKDKSEKEIPLPEHILEVNVLPPPITKKIEKPPEIATKIEKPLKQPKIKKYRPSPPVEEWAKYETPDVVHPQQLKQPQKKESKPGPTKPKYGKPKERVEFKIPKSNLPVNDFIPKALPTNKPGPISRKQGKREAKVDSSSSGSSYCYECECIEGGCGC